MAQFAQPVSDVLTTGWGTTPLWSKIDEGSVAGADGETITETTTLAWFVVKLGSVTDPVSSVGHTMRMRWGKLPTAGPATAGTIELRQGYVDEGTPGTLIATFTGASGEGAYKDESYTLSGPETDSITDYPDLYLRAQHRGGTVEYIELEVPDAGGPPPTEEVSVAGILPGLTGSVTVEFEVETPGDLPPASVIAVYDASHVPGAVTDAVGSVPDEGPKAQNPMIQGTGTRQPLISESGFGGVRGLVFDGGDDFIEVAALDQTYSGDVAILLAVEVLTYPAISLAAGVIASTGSVPNKLLVGLDDQGPTGFVIMVSGGAPEDHHTASSDQAYLEATPSRFILTLLVRDSGEVKFWENTHLTHNLDLSASAPLNNLLAFRVGMREDTTRPAHILWGGAALVDLGFATEAQLLSARDDWAAKFNVPGFAATVEVDAILPGLVLASNVDASADAAVAGVLPGLVGAVDVDAAAQAAVAGVLPGLVGAVDVGVHSDVSVAGVLPGLTLEATIVTEVQLVTVAGVLPGLELDAAIGVTHQVSVAGLLPGLEGAAAVEANADVQVAGVLPGLEGSASVEASSDVAVAGVLPGLEGSAEVETSNAVAVAGVLPGLELEVEVAASTELAVAGVLPGLILDAMITSGTPVVTVQGVLPGLVGYTEVWVRQDVEVAGVLPGLGLIAEVNVGQDVSVAGELPGLEGAADVDVTNRVQVAGQLPGLEGSVAIGTTVIVVVAGQLPGLVGSVNVAAFPSVSVDGILPGLIGGVLIVVHVPGSIRPVLVKSKEPVSVLVGGRKRRVIKSKEPEGIIEP